METATSRRQVKTKSIQALRKEIIVMRLTVASLIVMLIVVVIALNKATEQSANATILLQDNTPTYLTQLRDEVAKDCLSSMAGPGTGFSGEWKVELAWHFADLFMEQRGTPPPY